LSSLKNILRFELLFTEINETINDSFSHLVSNVTKSSPEKVDAAPALVPIGRVGAISLHNVQVRIGGIKEASEMNDVKVLDLMEARAESESTQSMMSDRAIDFCVLQICWELGGIWAPSKATETKFFQGFWYDGRLPEHCYRREGTVAYVREGEPFELGECRDKGEKIGFG